MSVLGIVDSHWKSLHYVECRELLPRLKDLRILTTFMEVKALGEIFCEKTFKDRFDDLLPYPIFQFQHEDLKRALGIQMNFDVDSVAQVIEVLSSRRTGNSEIWRYLYEYLRDAQRDFKLDGKVLKLPLLFVPGQLQHLREAPSSNHVPLQSIRWDGDEEIASLSSTVLLSRHFPDSMRNLFVKYFGVLEGLTVADYVDSIKALHASVMKQQQTSKNGFESKAFSSLLLAYGSLNQVLEESNKSTLYPLDGLPVLIEKGKGIRDFEIYYAHEQRRGDILPHIDDW